LTLLTSKVHSVWGILQEVNNITFSRG